MNTESNGSLDKRDLVAECVVLEFILHDIRAKASNTPVLITDMVAADKIAEHDHCTSGTWRSSCAQMQQIHPNEKKRKGQPLHQGSPRMDNQIHAWHTSTTMNSKRAH